MMNLFKQIIFVLLCVFSSLAQAAWSVRYQHTDVLGSVIAESNAQGTITQRFGYKPFGEGSPTQKIGVGYTGHLEDTDLGLTYMQQRYYDPVIGRFYSNDPIGFRDPQSFNRYSYGNNNPYKFVDPTGMASNTPTGQRILIEQCQRTKKCDEKVMGDIVAKLVFGQVVSASISSEKGASAGLLLNKSGFELSVDIDKGGVGVKLKAKDGKNEVELDLTEHQVSLIRELVEYGKVKISGELSTTGMLKITAAVNIFEVLAVEVSFDFSPAALLRKTLAGRRLTMYQNGNLNSTDNCIAAYTRGDSVC